MRFEEDAHAVSKKNAVCIHCHHPPICHRRCPLQLRENIRVEDITMLTILREKNDTGSYEYIYKYLYVCIYM
jgi:cytidylate kinase